MQRLSWIPWRWWRRAAQLAVLAAFLWLFRRTEYAGADQLAGGENIFFRIDPLIGVAAAVAARQWALIFAFWPALVALGATLALGRFFCGWICPLGTLLDYFHRISRPIARRTNARAIRCIPDGWKWKRMRYVALFCVLAAAAFAFPLVGYVDPFALLVRGMTLAGDPLLSHGADAGFAWLDGRWGAGAAEPFIRKHLLAFRPAVAELAGVSAAILGMIFAMEFFQRRFWCRYLCPTGAFFGLVGRRSLLKRSPNRVCGACGGCSTVCRMGALDGGEFSSEMCNMCMDCVDACEKKVARFTFARRAEHAPGAASRVNLSRRSALAGIAVGAAAPGIAAAVRWARPTTVDPHLLRPPGATADEKTFLNLCVRCGECLKVCPTNVLQPAALEAGVEGVFSPRLVPRLIFEQSYCEYACTLCGQVCPTGAIPLLSETEKHERPIGKAYFDHARCLPWHEQTPCIRCEEMCPVPDKAIKILCTETIRDKNGDEVELQFPYVDRDLCIGCGICESNCTIDGLSAVRVFRVEAADPGTEFRLGEKKLDPNRRK